jgi:metallophosphoesterase (TIGR00282 family)
MNILYLGDVMGEAGLKVVEKMLPGLRSKHKIDLVIAQAENLSDGRGIKPGDFHRLLNAGVNFATGGNWTLHRKEFLDHLSDPDEPVIRPANYPDGTPGLGYKYIQTDEGKVLVISLLGQIVGKDADRPVENPLKIIDKILDEEQMTTRVATIVNFHGDFSSEKKIIGHYLDGRVTAVIGDHWHVQTADAEVLPKGTAYITDVGMCGSLDSSLGISFDSLIPRWRDGKRTKNELEDRGRMQFNALLVGANPRTGLATSVKPIRKVL